VGRPVLGFAITPLWVPLFVMCGSLLAPSVQVGVEVAYIAGILTFLAYLGTLVVGVPTYLALRDRQIRSVWGGIVLGLVLAGSTWLVVLAVGLWLLGIYGFYRAYADLLLVALAMTGAPAMLVGVTLWLLARPPASRRLEP
jgi:hypothetical protein